MQCEHETANIHSSYAIRTGDDDESDRRNAAKFTVVSHRSAAQRTTAASKSRASPSRRSLAPAVRVAPQLTAWDERRPDLSEGRDFSTVRHRGTPKNHPRRVTMQRTSAPMRMSNDEVDESEIRILTTVWGSLVGQLPQGSKAERRRSIPRCVLPRAPRPQVRIRDRDA
jgi:pyruvate/2-oxoglutarate dehydrogenase complex dihydrolipoamide acyltransferase (E2) component